MKINLFITIVLALIYTGCNRHHDAHEHEEAGIEDHALENDAEEHQHEDVLLQITAYSDDFELYAEADPFVKGKVSHILAHFSSLPDFKALETASVTVRLIINGEETIHTLEQATRKGIYSFDIEPSVSGNGILKFEIRTAKDNYKLIVSEITVYDDEHDAIHIAEDNEVHSSDGIIFTKEQSWKIDFATSEVKVEPFGQVIKTTARVISAQADEVIVVAKTSGIVVLSKANVLEGNSVSNGELLFSISGSGLADNNSEVRFMEAKNNYEKTKADYDRQKALSTEKIISEKELLTAKNQYDNAKLIYNNLKLNFNASGQMISSPMNGFIKQLFIQNGQFVEAGEPLLSISQNKTLLLHADVQQKYAAILGLIEDANIRTLHDNKTYQLSELNGKVLSYGKSSNEDNYLIPVHLQIDNKGTFIPGGFVELYLKTVSNSKAITIPNSALLEEQGNFFVYIQLTPELFEKRGVRTGATDGLRSEIIEGITEGERVVSKGAILIKLAQTTGTLDAHSGHVH